MGKSKTGIYIIIILAAIVLIYMIQAVNPSEHIDRTKCPYEEEGNLSADFVIKYVDSPFCVWCWLEEPVLKKMVKTKGDSFKLERYDIRHCTSLVRKYGFSGTPSFVFGMRNSSKEYTRFGYLNENAFNIITCSVLGGC